MAKIYFRKKTLYALKEATYGAGGAITGNHAIRTRDLTISPLEGEVIQRGYDKSNFGADLGSLVGVHVLVTCKVPFSGSGVVGTAPGWGTLMKGCGHKETVVAGTSVAYTPVDDDPDSLVLRFERDKVLHSIVGTRGGVKLTTDKRNYPWLEYSFMGLFMPPVKLLPVDRLVPVFTSFKNALPFRATTVDCSIAGNVVGLHNMNIDFGQKTEYYEHSEEEAIQISDRSASFQASFEEPEIDVHDYYADVLSEATGALSYKHGITAGNIVTVTSPLTQINKPTLQNVQGVSALQVTGPLVADGTAPDYTITCT